MHRVPLFVALLLAPSVSHACSCSGPNPICSAYWQSSVVFRGRVIEEILESHTNRTVKNLDGTSSTIETPGYYRVRLAVLEMFRGTPQSQEIEILTNEQNSACGFSFVAGAEYIVFADTNQETNELWTSKCSHTHQLEPDKEDAEVAWMRALATAPKFGTIYGSLFLTANQADSNFSATIHLRGPESRNAVPDLDGKYTFPNLRPGQYTVSASLPVGFTSDPDRTVAVPEKGCSQIDWFVRYDGHVRGIVTDTGGHRLPGILMVLQRRDSDSATGFADIDLKVTDVDGRYDFAPVPPGDYLVSANHLGPSPKRPYPRFYYGNTESDADAATIHLPPSGIVDNIDVSLPIAWKTVTIQARVLLPEGGAAVGADVSAYDVNYLHSGEPASADANEEGRVTLSLFEGRTYYLVATISGGTQQRCAGPLKFAAKDGVTLPTITIEHNWGNCLAQLNPDFQEPR